jgi:inositol hexakisphosphate/diphosphoinositol-pentakisphosphate kinase
LYLIPSFFFYRAFSVAKKLLELKEGIAPILVSSVHKEQDSLHMLDPSGNKEVKKELEDCKQRINRNLQTDFEVASSSVVVRKMAVGPLVLQSLHTALKKVGKLRRHLFEILALLKLCWNSLKKCLT